MSSFDSLIHIVKPLGFIEYVALQKQAICVLSDSGTVTEEASLLGFAAVMLRQAHERPEGMDEGTLILCDLDPERILESIELAVAQGDQYVPHALWVIIKLTKFHGR